MSGDDARSGALIDALTAIVGTEHVLLDDDLRAGYETDWTGRFHGRSRAVLRPADPEQVAAVLAACSAAGVAVVPQGGNTGLVGGSVPRGGEVVVSLLRTASVDVDAEQGEAVVGAGATLSVVQDAARDAGWDVGVDLSSRDSCTIGGMVATNAGGEHVLRYGPMADQLVGVEAALAAGTLVGRVPALRKDNTGYHWPGLIAGSEGTLAIVTRVHLRLVPRLPDRVVVLLAVDDLDAALRVSGRFRRAVASLVALEVCFADGIELVREHFGLPAPFTPAVPVVLLAECAQATGGTDDLVAELAVLVASSPDVRDSAVAADARTREQFWRYREGHADAINAAGVPHKLDVTLPFDRLAEFEASVRKRVEEVAPGSRVILFGHLGDGNLHVNVLGPPPDDPAVDDAVLDLVVALGGSISAEHGIGVAKRAALARSRPAAELAAMRAVKRALDPHGVLNPGVLFAD